MQIPPHDRKIDDPSSDDLTVADLIRIQKQFETALIQTRETKTRLLLKSISNLKEQVKGSKRKMKRKRCAIDLNGLASDGSSTSTAPVVEGKEMTTRNLSEGNSYVVDGSRKGMVLAFTQLSLAFDHMNYYVDMPAGMKKTGIEETCLQLLRDSGGREPNEKKTAGWTATTPTPFSSGDLSDCIGGHQLASANQ
ncbi:hypothetical protein SASPL_142569 [Salvia splendens]|uniref:Uncharacterized protein n=1 Tax=Salvia splendens TaxID=180675 RepID=A0A8X8Z9Y3_SALSN|nr:hypothetical protein SASPL_142569 [Salvia splendens]